MMSVLVALAFSFFSAAGWSVIVRVPASKIPICGFIGALSWVAYLAGKTLCNSPAIGCFIAALLVGLLSGACAKLLKEAATVFIVPGIVNIVPGAYIYFTMEAAMNEQVNEAAIKGIETIMMAGAIAMGILVSGAVIALVRGIVKKTTNIKNAL